MKTVVFESIITGLICTLAIALLWRRHRERFAGMLFWMADYLLHTLVVFLILLRGIMPASISIIISVPLMLTGMLFMYMGLQSFVGRTEAHIHNYILLAVFVFINTYFAVIQTSLDARSLILLSGILIFSFQCMWLLFFGVDVGMRQITLGAGMVFAGYCVLSIIRIISIIFGPTHGNEFFQSGEMRTLMILSYQMLFIIQTYSLVLMVNRRLLMDILINEKEIKGKNEELTRLVYTVSHDLKTPLVTIKYFLGFLKKDIAKQDEKALANDIGLIQNAVDKMGLLLDELLDLSRVKIESESKADIPLESVVKSALDLVAGIISKSKIKISTTKDKIMLYGDPQRLIQLYQNLIDNAVKFMGNQPEPIVEIGAKHSEGRIILFVRDNGKGIDQKQGHRLFRLFEKLDEKSEGTGVGLALIKRIVEVHNGAIWFESEGIGKGTTFYFTLEGTRLI
jgi:signal transduction histidine kinase